ncbi:MAG: HAD family hydrolase [Haloferacaceae archaeon]
MYETVVFDCDGVLVHPTPTGTVDAAVEATLRSFGVEPDPEVVDALTGRDLDRVRELCLAHDLDPEAFWAEREARAAAVQGGAMRAGRKPAYDDVSALRDLDRPLGIVSNNQQATVDRFVETFGFEDLFATVYGREPSIAGLRRMKPDPHYLHRALDDLGVAPADALFVGDSTADLRAAEAAGADAAFVRRPHRRDYDPAVDPVHEVTSLREVRDLLSA